MDNGIYNLKMYYFRKEPNPYNNNQEIPDVK